ncbi:MAG TPA: A/G-specific adenine glycosylase [Alphaproteobacteria bacterium]|nr:A/G-specific adenine glycosylase [Alphaproteobacteria bacterium]
MKDTARLWQWFQKNARDLPWRKTIANGLRDPYRVWLAEIMLQQTQVATVVPYYEKFLRHYPTLKKLAASPQEKILSDWAGLGYYSRARNLHKCAQVVQDQFKGKWPCTAAELQKLPGLGPYTAAAMAALAFGENILAIDGNVARVLSRYGAIQTPIAKARTELLAIGENLLYSKARGGSAEALIELGAMICTPKNPKCNACPLRQNCRALAAGEVLNYPVKTALRAPQLRSTTALILTNDMGEILTITRGGKGLFAGMLALPTSALQPGEADHALYQKYVACAKNKGKITHILTHIKFEVKVLHHEISTAEAKKIKTGKFLKAKIAAAQMPSLFQKIIKLR